MKAWRMIVGLGLIVAGVGGTSSAGVSEMRALVTNNPALSHLWTFDGANEAAQLSDKKGSVNLARVTAGGGSPATFAAAFGSDGSAAQTYRTDLTNGSGYRTTATFTPSANGTIEYLYRPGGVGGHVVSINPNASRLYAGIDYAGSSTVALGNGTFAAAERTFLGAGTVPNYTTGHWYYVALNYARVGSSNLFDVFVADLDEGQTTLSRTVQAQATTCTVSYAAAMLGIGMQGDTGKNFFEGMVDEVAFYNQTLSPGTLQMHLDVLLGTSRREKQKLLVGDYAGHRVLQYSVTAVGLVAYDKVFAQTSDGSGLQYPRSMARIGGTVFISQTDAGGGGTAAIRRYTLEGAYLSTISVPSNVGLGGSLVTDGTALYVADPFKTHNIYKVSDPNGGSPVFSMLISSNGPYSGVNLNNPRGLALGPNGNLFVGDRNNNRILEFQKNGTYVGRFDSGTAPRNVQAIAWHDGKLYATVVTADDLQGCIDYWNSNGTYGGRYAVAAALNNIELAFNPLGVDLFHCAWHEGVLRQTPPGGGPGSVAAGAGTFGDPVYTVQGPMGLLFFELPPAGTSFKFR